MDQDKFWHIIETAWSKSPELNKVRKYSLTDPDKTLFEELEDELQHSILKNYTSLLRTLNKQDLTSFIQILEERIYHIDREEIQEYTDGSDDGFLFARCFIVGMGRQYYTMIDQDPSQATMFREAEQFGFAAYGVYRDLFNEEFDRSALHAIESGSNPLGWPAI